MMLENNEGYDDELERIKEELYCLERILKVEIQTINNLKQQIKNPISQQYDNIIKSCKKSDLTEIRSFNGPPAFLVWIMEAVLIIFNFPLVPRINQNPFGPDTSYGINFGYFRQSFEFYTSVVFYDPQRLNGQTLQLLEPFVQNTDFNKQKAGIICRGAIFIVQWVKCLNDYLLGSVQQKTKQLIAQQIKRTEEKYQVAVNRTNLLREQLLEHYKLYKMMFTFVR